MDIIHRSDCDVWFIGSTHIHFYALTKWRCRWNLYIIGTKVSINHPFGSIYYDY